MSLLTQQRRALEQLREQVAEREAKLLARTQTVDPDPVAWSRDIFGDLTLDPWQEEVLRAGASAERALAINACRQSGKSTITAAAVAHMAAGTPEQPLLVISPSFRQSALMRDKISFCLSKKSVPHEKVRDAVKLANGSVVVILPGDDADKVRGYTAAAVVVDEAAFVRDSVASVVLPMIAATSGRLIALSTPNGASGFFYDFVHTAGTHVITVKAEDIPRFDEAVIADLRARLGARAAQELDCHFMIGAKSLFSAEALASMFGNDPAEDEVVDAAIARDREDGEAARAARDRVEKWRKDTRSPDRWGFNLLN